MGNPLMATFRLVGAQIKTAKAEMSKARPKGSPRLTPEQKAYRAEAQRWYGEATQIYTVVERVTEMGAVQLDTPANRARLKDASWKAFLAQDQWRKAHPSDAVEIKVVTV